MASVTILSDNGATSGSAGLKTSGGNDGVLLLQTTTSGGTPTTAISISNTQVVTYTNQPTYTGGTANGVLYLNGSKAVTSGTALVFDGTNLGIGTSSPSTYGLLAVAGSAGAASSPVNALSLVNTADGSVALNFVNAVTTAANPLASIRGLVTSTGAGTDDGVLAFYTAANAASSERARIDSNGNMGIGTTSPAVRLHVSGGLRVADSTNSANYIVFGSGNDSPIGNNSIVSQTGSLVLGTNAASTVLQFVTVGAERARIDSNGVLLVNATSRANASDHTAIKLAVFGEAHLQQQGCHLWFGDSTNASPLGIGEGLVNTVGTDQDFLSVYYRASCRFFTGTSEVARFDNSSRLLQLAGRKSNAYTLGNQQMWVYASGGVANGGTIALCAINQIYDNLCYELDIFVNRGGYFAAKYAGVFGYNGFTKAITTGDTGAAGLTMTGTTYNETMTITNSSGVTVNQYIFCLRVWGLGTAGSVSTGGADLVTSSYLTRIE